MTMVWVWEQTDNEKNWIQHSQDTVSWRYNHGCTHFLGRRPYIWNKGGGATLPNAAGTLKPNVSLFPQSTFVNFDFKELYILLDIKYSTEF